MGFFPVFFPPEGGLGLAAVQTQPGPVDALQTVVLQQPGRPQGQEDTGLDPLLEAVVGGGAGAEPGGVQRLPLAAGAQDEKDGIHTHPIRGAGPTAPEAMGVNVRGQVHSDLGPQVVGDAPLVSNEILVHESTEERRP